MTDYLKHPQILVMRAYFTYLQTGFIKEILTLLDLADLYIKEMSTPSELYPEQT